jgi:ribulose-phosphate 3-epimerase
MVYYPEFKIAPSLLSADYSRLGEEIRDVETKGADLLHIDVMDGHFVPNITIGPDMVKDIRKVTPLPLDVHLMITNPQEYLLRFESAGADIITFHIEVFIKNKSVDIPGLKKIFEAPHKARLGMVINPPTDVEYFKQVVNEVPVDFILVMSVNPGFGGQEFIPEVLDKVRYLRKELNFKGDIEIDGGINHITAKSAIEAGCNILVAGSYIFKSSNRKRAIQLLKESFNN